MQRRAFLRAVASAGAGLSFGPAFWGAAWARDYAPADGPYGPLGEPDPNGIRLPAGFSSRVIGLFNTPVNGTTYLWPPFPDGSATFADLAPDNVGGWFLVTNSEFPPAVDQYPDEMPGSHAGGVSSVRFNAAGDVVEAAQVLSGSRSNCAGGVTPWGTWLSGEEYDGGPGSAGLVWEVDPTGQIPGVAHPAMGVFKHEAVAVDTARGHMYLSEDQGDGLLYRFTAPVGGWPSGPGAFMTSAGGTLEAARVGDDGAVTWVPIADPSSVAGTCRAQGAALGATTFDGGEGIFWDSGHVYLTTKNDGIVWDLDVSDPDPDNPGVVTKLFDPEATPDNILNGVDNLIVSPWGDVLVAEDGDDMQVVLLTETGEMAPLLQMTGSQHGEQALSDIVALLPDPISRIPVESEVTGLAFSPDGTRLYCSSQRGFGGGVTYEITGPFNQRYGSSEPGRGLTAPGDASTSSPARVFGAVNEQSRSLAGDDPLAATGSRSDTGRMAGAAAAAAAAGALVSLRRRALDQRGSGADS